MHPDDMYRAQRITTITALRYWAPTVRDCAHVTEEEPGGYWRLRVIPFAAGACPFELILLEDRFYSLMLDGRGYEDMPVARLQMMVPLVEAIANGDVARGLTTSTTTGRLLAITDRVTMADGSVWTQSEVVEHGWDAGTAADDTIERIRRYLPYHR
ncbi:MAG: hypothetical protein NW217_00935 [Hyphomicrobiaceae bacterium]|nr:hypothetical protein [Hyphomicrobiaceae bacterium]